MPASIAMRWTLIYLIASLLACGGRAIAASDHRTGVFRPAAYEIGIVGSEDCVFGKFVLSNTSQQELVLRNVRTNCACYKIAHSVNRLHPGESATVEFDLALAGLGLGLPVNFNVPVIKEGITRVAL